MSTCNGFRFNICKKKCNQSYAEKLTLSGQKLYVDRIKLFAWENLMSGYFRAIPDKTHHDVLFENQHKLIVLST